MRRTEKDIQVFGGDVYFDIDGKNVGKLSKENQEVLIPAGCHTIRMYKSHSFDSFIGFAETAITVEEEEQLLVRYAAPIAVNQPGNLIISTYDPQMEAEVLRARETAIQRDYAADEARKNERNKKYHTGTIIWIVVIVISMVGFFIWEVSIWH